MIPIKKVQDIIAKYDNLEKELSSGKIDTKLFAQKSKEYSSLGNVISYAREFVRYESEKNDKDINNSLSNIKKALRAEQGVSENNQGNNDFFLLEDVVEKKSLNKKPTKK